MTCTSTLQDRLQDEVPEVIADLAKAGITLWMLTGDKEETAVQIGHSCNLVDPETELIVITKCENKAQFELRLGQAFSAAQDMYHDAEPCNGDTNRGPVDRRASAIQIQIDSLTLKMQCMMENLHAKSAEAINWFSRGTMNMNRENMRYLDGSRKVALVIDGPSLEFMDMKNTEQRQMLLQVGLVCRSVIGCRLTPIQKQQLVNIVKVGADYRLPYVSRRAYSPF